MVHPQTAFLVVGLLFIALPATAWTILHRRHDRASVMLWCGGGLIYGIGFILIALRDVAPAGLGFLVASPLTFAGYLLRGLALEREIGARRSIKGPVGVCLFFSVAYWSAYGLGLVEGLRLLVPLAGNLCGALWLAGLAWAMYRKQRYRSAGMLTAAYSIFALALLVRLISVMLHYDQAKALSSTVDFALAFISSIVAALYGNLGYIGIALEASRSQELARNAELARAQEQRAQTELRSLEQAALLEERSQLLAAREEMLAALAHEVRQPLNNASAALQSAALALHGDGQDQAQASLRLRRAKTVLTQVTASLDNTLTDAVLLGGTAPLACRDIDVDTLVSLTIGDIDEEMRGRILLDLEGHARTASMNAGLIRIALRNLIANGLAYGPEGSTVRVRVADCDDPLALTIEVSDEGAGIPAELQARLFRRGARGGQLNNPHGHGLGLYIVKRIMEMHGGAIEVLQRQPTGLTMRLIIPQALPQ